MKTYTLKKKVLVVGGTGFIGSNLIKALRKKNFLVSSVSLNKENKNKYKYPDVNYLFFDISKKKLLKNIRGSFDYVINLSGNINHDDNKTTYLSHYVGVKNLIDFFLKTKVKKFIQFGSSTEYGFDKAPQKEESRIRKRKLKSVYSQSKLKATNYSIMSFKKYKFPATVVRLFLAYGPGQKKDRMIPFIIDSCLKDKNFDCSAGNQLRDYVYIDDVINFILFLLKKKNIEGQIFNLGSGNPIKIKDVIVKIHKQIKKGYPRYGAVKLRKDEPENLYSDKKKVTKILKWKPKIDFDFGLKKTIKFYKSNKF